MFCSTEVKFSQHFIFHIPGAVFRDNRHTGMPHLCSLLCNGVLISFDLVLQLWQISRVNVTGTFVKLCIGKLTEFCQVDYGQ